MGVQEYVNLILFTFNLKSNSVNQGQVLPPTKLYGGFIF